MNLYGPGDNFDYGTSHGTPALIRKCYDGPEPVNLGTGEEVTIAELARMVAAEVGVPAAASRSK